MDERVTDILSAIETAREMTADIRTDNDEITKWCIETLLATINTRVINLCYGEKGVFVTKR